MLGHVDARHSLDSLGESGIHWIGLVHWVRCIPQRVEEGWL